MNLRYLVFASLILRAVWPGLCCHFRLHLASLKNGEQSTYRPALSFGEQRDTSVEMFFKLSSSYHPSWFFLIEKKILLKKKKTQMSSSTQRRNIGYLMSVYIYQYFFIKRNSGNRLPLARYFLIGYHLSDIISLSGAV